MNDYNKLTERHLAELESVVGRANLLYGDPDVMETYSHDEVSDAAYASMPEVVVKPASTQEVSKIVRMPNRGRALSGSRRS